MKLHEAMVLILSRTLTGASSTIKISEVVQAQNLYRKKNRGFASQRQIYLRARQYPELFRIISQTKIGLKDLKPWQKLFRLFLPE